MWRRIVTALASALLIPGVAAAPAGAAPGPDVYTGKIDGTRFRVEVPATWNGTLLLWSHGAYSREFPPGDEIALTNHPATRQWLLDQGYALAASRYREPYGWLAVESGLRDQRAVLDWFDDNVGRPERTVSWGASVGGLIATLIAERDPRRFHGVASLCGATAGGVATFNAMLDMNVALKELLAPDSALELVDIADPAGNVALAREILDRAQWGGDPVQRARLALATSLADVTSRFTSRTAPPPTVEDQVLQQYLYAYHVHAGYWGTTRTEMEARAGGNPSWNTGVDYRRQLARSGQRALVEQAYREAGLDLGADLDRLNATPRIQADPRAVSHLARYGFPVGSTPWPVVTLHSTGDGTTPAEHPGWYADQVARHGDPGRLRQLWIDRGYHCAFTASEEIVTVRTLLDRIDTGQWGGTDPDRLNPAATSLGTAYQTVWDWDPEAGYHPDEPAFVAHQPDPAQRPFPY